VATVGVLANATAAVLGRRVNRRAQLSPLTVTFVSMGIGATLLLALGLATQGLGGLALRHGLLVGWLAVINTALAFTLWNYTLRTLSAVESSILNGLMLPQIALLAWIFLDESLNRREVSGLALAGIGAVLVQIRPRARQKGQAD
jgi:drug/metabolite transporter (DMT)-like permease